MAFLIKDLLVAVAPPAQRDAHRRSSAVNTASPPEQRRGKRRSKRSPAATTPLVCDECTNYTCVVGCGPCTECTNCTFGTDCGACTDCTQTGASQCRPVSSPGTGCLATGTMVTDGNLTTLVLELRERKG